MLQLKLHPDSVCEAVTRIDVLLARQLARLEVRFIIHGHMAALRIPPIEAPSRIDELWQHTCCEAFIGVAGEAYYEFNLSPSTQWAAYRFIGYRQGMANAEVSAPAVAVSADATRLELDAVIDCTPLAGSTDQWRVGLSMVIEEQTGRKSYWALAHAEGKADFHHANGFVIELEP